MKDLLLLEDFVFFVFHTRVATKLVTLGKWEASGRQVGGKWVNDGKVVTNIYHHIVRLSEKTNLTELMVN